MTHSDNMLKRTKYFLECVTHYLWSLEISNRGQKKMEPTIICCCYFVTYITNASLTQLAFAADGSYPFVFVSIFRFYGHFSVCSMPTGE